MKKHILVTDNIAAAGVDYLCSHDEFVVEKKTELNEEELLAIMPGYHAVIVRSATNMTARIIEAAPDLKVIGRAGIGVDNIDVKAATIRGIAVLNTPDANATTTAELTVAHMLSLSRNLPQADRSVKAGAWQRSQFMGAELAGKLLGIIGYGAIGRIVASRALALDMQVKVYDPFVTEERLQADGVAALVLDALVAEADYLTLHCPVTAATRNILSAERLASMKPGARLINCARGGLVDETALYALLKSGHLAGAALDVFADEPPGDSPLLALDNIVLTPHLGASTHEAQNAAGADIARQVAVYLQTGEPINAINLPAVSAEESRRLQPYLLLAGNLGRLLEPMIRGAIDKLEVSLCGDAALRDSQSIATAGLVGWLSVHMSAPVNRINARLIAEQHGVQLVESRCGEHPDYHTTVSLTAHHGAKTTTVTGALFDKKHPRLVRINRYEIEAFLEGHLLFTRHVDKPGVMAAITGLLADNHVNIARMQLGIVAGSDKAVAVMEVSDTLSATIMEQLAKLPAITKVMQVSMT